MTVTELIAFLQEIVRAGGRDWSATKADGLPVYGPDGRFVGYLRFEESVESDA